MKKQSFWIQLSIGANEKIGCSNQYYGVTAVDQNDALQLIREAVLNEYGVIPEINNVSESVGTDFLDEKHVIPNMANINLYGIWYPSIYFRKYSIAPNNQAESLKWPLLILKRGSIQVLQDVDELQRFSKTEIRNREYFEWAIVESDGTTSVIAAAESKTLPMPFLHKIVSAELWIVRDPVVPSAAELTRLITSYLQSAR